MLSSTYKAFNISILIVRLVVPFFIISSIFQYFGYIENIAFLFEPITSFLSLPSSVALAFAAAFFFNMYAGIAIATGLSLSSYEWTIVGTFIAICHSIPVEAAVLKKIGFSIHLHWIMRLVLGMLGAWIAALFIPQESISSSGTVFESPVYNNFTEMLVAATVSSIMLALKIVGLVTALILGFDLIRKFPAIDKLMDKHTYLSCLMAGGLLGITYGAGILIKDMEFVGEKHRIYLILFLLLAE